jgi:hypothetical protein
MSSIKISQLPQFTTLDNNNTGNVVFVGVDTQLGTTGQYTATTIANGLYLNNSLIVGNNIIQLPNTVAQFSGNVASYMQINEQNFNPVGTADFILTADTGTDSGGYVDLGINNSQWNPVTNGQTSQYPLDGYLIVDGPGSGPTGNLILGTANPGTNVVFAVGGYYANNIVATITPNSLAMNTATHITFGDGTVLASANTTTLAAAFAQANSAAANSIYQTGVNAAQNTWIQSAWNEANTSLQNTTNIITAGNFAITGNLNSVGTISANTFAPISNVPAIKITGSNNFITQSPLQQGYMMQITGVANTSTRVIIDSFGANTYGLLAGRTARGSAAAPASSANGDILMRLSGNGWGSTGFSPFGVGRIDIVATENYTDTTKGSQIQFWNTQAGTNTLINIATFNAVDAQFYGYVNPQKGFVYTPTVYPSSQTAITIDFTNNSLVRAQTATGLTVTLSNLLAGKEVVAWITNTSGTNQTFTHGLSATNSTLNATNYAIPGTSTILVRYMCIDGTLANTFVAVTHA